MRKKLDRKIAISPNTLCAPARFHSQHGDTLILSVLVRTEANKNLILGEYGGRLKISLRARPINNQANRALLKFIAELFAIPQSGVKLLHGLSSKYKTIAVTNCRLESLAPLLVFTTQNT